MASLTYGFISNWASMFDDTVRPQAQAQGSTGSCCTEMTVRLRGGIYRLFAARIHGYFRRRSYGLLSRLFFMANIRLKILFRTAAKSGCNAAFGKTCCLLDQRTRPYLLLPYTF
jgi:hypothetical protein